MKTYWIWFDVKDYLYSTPNKFCGSGPRWNLAIKRDDMLYFPEEDFEENSEVFDNFPNVEVEEPPSRGGKTIDALVRILTMCQQHEDMRFAASELHDQLLKAIRESVKEGS